VTWRSLHIPFDVIADKLGRTTGACHTKYYSVVNRKTTPDRYMEILSDPYKYLQEHDVDDAEKLAIARAFLREMDYEVGGRENIVLYGDEWLPIKVAIGKYTILYEKHYKERCVLVWVQASGDVVVLVVV